MKRTRLGMTLSAAALGLATLGGVAACGSGTDSLSLAADSTPEQQALAQLGVNPADLNLDGNSATPAPSTSPSAGKTGKAGKAGKAGKGGRGRLIRLAIRKHTLHAETTVQTKKGVETIAGQRGTITAVTSTSVTVKSTDGYTETWTYASPIHVRQNKAEAQTSALKTGEQIGIAGPVTGGRDTAKLIVVTAS